MKVGGQVTSLEKTKQPFDKLRANGYGSSEDCQCQILLEFQVSLTKRHHYTPRYYLKRFENPEGKIWRCDVESGAVVKGHTEKFGLQKHWNTLANPPSGYSADWAERRLTEVDGPASMMVQKILSGQLPTDILALAYAISFMQNNQPRLMRELEENHADEIAHWSDDWKLIVRINTALANGPSYRPKCYALYEIEDSLDARFLTSSNPLIEFSNMPNKLFPLSSRHCLFLSYDDGFAQVSPKILKCDHEIVSGINRRTLENAWQYVYSSTPDFDE